MSRGNGVAVLDDVFSLQFDPGAAPRQAGAPANPGCGLPAFIGDGESRLVQTAVEEALRPQPHRWNPLLFAGPQGVGKSMLARGLYGRLATAVEGECLFYTGAGFSRACGLAMDTNTVAEFRRRIYRARTLVVDDLHQVAGKPLAQEELIHALEQLAETGQRFIATLRQAPLETHSLMAALASRLSAGLLVPLHPPGDAARREIVRQLAARLDLHLTPPVIDHLAGLDGLRRALRPAPTVPQLSLQISRLAEVCREITTLDDDHLARILGDLRSEGQPDLRSITSAVARYFEQRPDELRGAARRKELVHARGIAMYLARQLTNKSLEHVGKYFGNRDHTTVLHACRRMERLIEQDPAVQKAVEELASQFLCQ